MRNARAARIVVAAVLVLSGAYLAACKSRLPGAPSELTGGIVIYEHANFLGESAHISTDVRDLKSYDGPCRHDDSGFDNTSSTTWDWNDCMSSIRVVPGWRGVVYRDGNFHGQSLQFSADVPNLALEMGTCDHDGMNDCVTSIRVFSP